MRGYRQKKKSKFQQEEGEGGLKKKQKELSTFVFENFLQADLRKNKKLTEFFGYTKQVNPTKKIKTNKILLVTPPGSNNSYKARKVSPNKVNGDLKESMFQENMPLDA